MIIWGKVIIYNNSYRYRMNNIEVSSTIQKKFHYLNIVMTTQKNINYFEHIGLFHCLNKRKSVLTTIDLLPFDIWFF